MLKQQFVDHDHQNNPNEIYRKYDVYCGIKNLNNTCYLNVVLQILYNVEWLRQKLLSQVFSHLPILSEIQKLFALMYQGYLSYVDPSSLFEELKKGNPSTFIEGKQSDFQEIFSFILCIIQDGLNSNDKIIFQSLFYGKSKIQLTDQNMNRLNNDGNEKDGVFCLLNIPCSSLNLQEGIETIKTQIISGYRNSLGQSLRVIKRLKFIKTPIYINLIINRVQFQNNKFIKNSCQFEYQQRIVLNNQVNSSRLYSHNNKKFQQELQYLNEGLAYLKKAKDNLIGSLKYFQIKDLEHTDIKTANNKSSHLNNNAINNKSLNQPNPSIKIYLKDEISEIDFKCQEIQIKIKGIENQRKALQQQNQLQVYHLQGLMIHCGQRAQSGHYKLCLKVNIGGNKVWVEFNDKSIYEITESVISEYKRKGQICGLLYKKGKQSSSMQPLSKVLLNYVQEKQRQMIMKMDNIKIQQLLYEQNVIVNSTWEILKNKIHNKKSISIYFFYPLLHLTLEGASVNTCKSFLLYENIKQPLFIDNMKERLINWEKNLSIPEMDFGIPQQYYMISDMLKQFLLLEITNPPQSYELDLLHAEIPIKNFHLLDHFVELKKLIILKSTFYESMFVKFNFLQLYEPFSRNVNSIINSLPKSELFLKKVSTVRKLIRERYELKSLNQQIDLCSIFKKSEYVSKDYIKDFGESLFQKRFQFWIYYLKNIQKFNQDVFKEYQHFYSAYIIHTE